jgi:acyl-[acyl-carrier-protein]-phospholipid O-acyltransferase/long-chain-fatty-acid--[acyl-carrier-protein] ligase
MEAKLEPVPGIAEGGLLHVRGPNVMLGYWKEDRPAELQFPSSVFGAGWYNTGDIATIDDDGFIQLRGRARRFAKVAGEMISLEVVEKIAYAASPAVAHAVISRPDAGRGEMLVLFTTDAKLKREQLLLAAREIGAPEIAVPRRVQYLDKIPLLGNGKKDYPTLERLAV